MMSRSWSARIGGAEYHIELALLDAGDGALDFLSKYSCITIVMFCKDEDKVCSGMTRFGSKTLSSHARSGSSNQNWLFLWRGSVSLQLAVAVRLTYNCRHLPHTCCNSCVRKRKQYIWLSERWVKYIVGVIE